MEPSDIKFKGEYGMYIGGKRVKSSSGKTLKAVNPADGSVLASFQDAAREDVDAAVRAARQAFGAWSQTTVKERARILNQIADLIDAHREELALIETLDNGKPIRETLNVDVPLSAEHFRYFAGVILSEEGSASVLDGAFLSLVLREPIGVVGQIVPWNFPLLMGAWKLAPVIAAGDCTVFKPSSATSLSILRLAELIGDLLPPGVFNVVTGAGSRAGDWLLENKDVDKLAFTGSTEVGYEVAKAAASRLIPATLELGGKSANIFFDDCRIEQALDGAQLGILFNQGQVCCAGSRIFVQDTFYDEFVEKLVKAFSKVKVGTPWDPQTQMGSQVSRSQMQKILSYIEIAKQEGDRILCGGKRVNFKSDEDWGFYIAPTLIETRNDSRVAREEIFGPVAAVIKFHDEEEAVAMANDNPYGLGGAVWTRDLNKALRVARGVRTGRMWVNTYNQIPEGAPFGGYKISGIGRETHRMILNHYTQAKNIMINLSEKGSGLY
ncbi:MAG: aldehyde dehydrogenase family protein [Succinivibrio sp.]|jgi:acyl-CoA reductase-like NAD-dependent aldehyde dehydrogenase|nr:aldehyde dehydrogenase family protein [Succinivibrio sp.]